MPNWDGRGEGRLADRMREAGMKMFWGVAAG